MALESKDKSLAALQALQSDKSNDKQYQGLLGAVNELAALADIALDKQSPEVLAELFNQMRFYQDETSHAQLPIQIFSALKEIMDKETDKNRREHRGQGSYDKVYIHFRSKRDELQDHDITFLMPNSTECIDVLAPLNRFKGSLLALQEGMKFALADEKIKHIFIPVGPGHWRGVYLTKPSTPYEKYNVEIFDPFGPGGAEAIKSFVQGFLRDSGIASDNLKITFSGPLKPQRDGYACGDFTCAYSHRMMRQLGAEEAYNKQLVDILDAEGNAKDALRDMTRTIFKAAFPVEPQRLPVNTNNWSHFEKTGKKAKPANRDENTEIDWIFYFKCFSRLAMLAGGIMLAVGLWLPMTGLAIPGFCVFGMGFFTSNQFSSHDSGKATQLSFDAQ